MSSDALEQAFRLQAGGCKLFGSPLYAGLVDAALRDLKAEGPIHRLLAPWKGDPLRGFVVLRVLGAVHEQVLRGEAPELARHYPTAGGSPVWPGVWHAFRDVVDEHTEALRPRLENFPQTNEVRRCAGLLPGFLSVAQRFGLPLRVLETGASAGLNLQWARFHYELGAHRWGDPDSPAKVRADWSEAAGVTRAAPFDVSVEVESRRGCDLAPIRITDPEAVLRLESFVWPDQPDRLELLRGAIAVARADPPILEQARAADWLEGELSETPDGVASVVYHSSFWIYLSPDERARIEKLFSERGARASERAPFAWLRHEDDPKRPGAVEVRLQMWPGGEDQRLAEAHPHGRRVVWGG